MAQTAIDGFRGLRSAFGLLLLTTALASAAGAASGETAEVVGLLHHDRAEPATGKPYRLDIDSQGRTVRLEGLIDFGITRDLEALLETSVDVGAVSLESPGGRVAEARGLIRVIERFALETAATGDCASACALVYMSGHTRYLAPGARLGFHRYGLFSPLLHLFLDPEAELAKDLALFHRHDVDEGFIERIAATPHETMWYPTTAELVSARVVDVLGHPE